MEDDDPLRERPMIAPYQHPAGRLATVTVDSRSWVEVWDADGGQVRVEYHRTVREPSVGPVDRTHHRTGRLRRSLAEVLPETVDADAILHTLEGRGVR